MVLCVGEGFSSVLGDFLRQQGKEALNTLPLPWLAVRGSVVELLFIEEMVGLA